MGAPAIRVPRAAARPRVRPGPRTAVGQLPQRGLPRPALGKPRYYVGILAAGPGDARPGRHGPGAAGVLAVRNGDLRLLAQAARVRPAEDGARRRRRRAGRRGLAGDNSPRLPGALYDGAVPEGPRGRDPQA